MTQVDRLVLKKPYYKTKHSVRKDGSLNGLVVLCKVYHTHIVRMVFC